MRKVTFGTSWQSKASMLPLPILIAQRLQIETLRGPPCAHKSCRKTQRQLHKQGSHRNSYRYIYRVGSVAYGESEVHPGFAGGFHRSRNIEQGKWYFPARIAVEGV